MISEDNFDVMRYANLMYDRRVIRGNTYALHLLPAQARTDPLELQRQVERRRRAIEQMRVRDELRPSSPLPLEGRLHKPVQTELYLEQLTDLVEETDMDCQTDAFLNRPPSPLYVPSKIGADAETQIYEGDLFNFDLEVVPVLEVLVGKTVEQALLEVTEEEELANIRAQQYAFEELRQAEQVEMQRVMEHDRRLREEKDRRKQQCLLAATREQELVDKVTAQAFAKAYLADLETTVFANLAEHGYFYDVVEHDIEEGFLPWLMAEVDEEIELENRSRLLLDLMIREVVQERHHQYRQLDLQDEQSVLNSTVGSDLTKGAPQQNPSSLEPEDETSPTDEQTGTSTTVEQPSQKADQDSRILEENDGEDAQKAPEEQEVGE
ncbi:uncharacterized protein DEA37_0014433 [Paragonimus westermani]|uniref:Radial spoke head protein 3 n=1 Tax=Paragonimus westermani TaxID=34504 RepID=A0A5J4NKS9_9TREM|nr:uncharacterized protein DEA37_0014433 [Paragonimus westermani]